MKVLKLFIALFIFLKLFGVECSSLEEVEKEEIKEAVEVIYQERNSLFIKGNLNELTKYYNKNSRYGTWALEHEIRRIKYLRKWAEERGMTFTSVESEPVFRKITGSGSKVRVFLNEYYKFTYIYKDEDNPVPNTFGVGLIHNIDLQKNNNLWIINWDWYTDCFEDALKNISSEIKDIPKENEKIYDLPIYDREKISELQGESSDKRIKAVNYGNKYCGIPWASKNPERYNKKYKNYTGVGGNCTNFVSQCLGDKDEGAALKQGGGWHWSSIPHGQREGSSAWVNADAFKNYLFYSGKGKLIKKGAFKDIILTDDQGVSNFEKLDYGDVICYSKGGDIDHFAIVTDFDSRGYPLINSHTTDRYKVPFDLGWGDKNIGFYLIKVKY